MAIKFADMKEGKIILFLTSAKKYMSSNLDIIKHYVNNKGFYCVYVTVNRPYGSLIKVLEENKIDTKKIFFIDSITPVSTGTQRIDNVVFIGSPRGLTNISITASTALNSLPKGKRLLFLDSLSTFSVYNDTGSVTKFAHFLVNRMREWNITGAIISLEKETDENMLAQLVQICDKSIEVK